MAVTEGPGHPDGRRLVPDLVEKRRYVDPLHRGVRGDSTLRDCATSTRDRPGRGGGRGDGVTGPGTTGRLEDIDDGPSHRRAGVSKTH